MVKVIIYSFPFWYLRLPYLFLPSFMAELNNKKAGFVVVPCQGKIGEIALISVDRDYRNLKIGTALLQKALDYLAEINASCCMAKVRQRNKAGLLLFNKVGFRTIKLIHRPVLGNVYLTKKDL